MRLPRRSGNPVVSFGQRHLVKDKDPVSFLRSEDLPVDGEGDGGRVGVHLDGGGLAAAAGITPAGQIDKGLLAPAGFVEIIGILADRAVIGDKAFAVAPFGGGHRPVGAAEVKHIPYKAAHTKSRASIWG